MRLPVSAVCVAGRVEDIGVPPAMSGLPVASARINFLGTAAIARRLQVNQLRLTKAVCVVVLLDLPGTLLKRDRGKRFAGVGIDGVNDLVLYLISARPCTA